MNRLNIIAVTTASLILGLSLAAGSAVGTYFEHPLEWHTQVHR